MSTSTCRSTDLAVHEPDYKNLVAFLKAMEFTTLTRRVVEQSGIDASAIEPNAKVASHEVAITSPPPPLSVFTSPACGGGRPQPKRDAREGATCSRPHPNPPPQGRHARLRRATRRERES